MKLLSPMTGWVAPLSEAPDEVFSGRMLGDGVGVDPTQGVLCAPCDAHVIGLARTHHAVTLKTADGAEILIHIGIETVALNGRGFTPHVAVGDRVKAGQTLMTFDLDALALGARSLFTPILVTNPDAFRITWKSEGREIGIGVPLMEIEPEQTGGSVVAGHDQIEHQRTVVLGLPHGLHARPAGRVSALAKEYAAKMDVTVRKRTAPIRSPIALMTLGAVAGEILTLTARGADADAALDALAAFLASDGGEAQSRRPPATEPVTGPTSAAEGLILGLCASPGLAVGRVAHMHLAEIQVERDGKGPDAERAALSAALKSVGAALAAGVQGASAGIMAAHLALLDDPELASAAEVEIVAGRSAAFAWGAALDAQAKALDALVDPRLRERADDLRDLKRRVQRALGGEPDGGVAVAEGAILIAEDLLPSDLIAVGGRISGVCTAHGGPTSHVAIIAASLGLPAVVAAGPPVLNIPEGAEVILDAGAGWLDPAPDKTRLAAAREDVAADALRRADVTAAAMEPCRLADGTRIEVFANLEHVADAAPAVARGAEGCGLLRTEFLFMDRPTAPGEDEQAAAYQAISDALDGRPLIVRTLDIGGDKPVAYLPLPAEDNPALGLRGVRLSLAMPDMLAVQLRAIVRTRTRARRRIMAPMVSSLEEFRAVRRLLVEVCADLGVTEPVDLGVMVETPAAALIAAELAQEADFLSIGTNDLTQYTLAMDRTNAAVASGVDALHPAVLRLIALTCDGAAKAGKWVGVCGRLASEPLAVPLLVGLGVTELSAAPAAIAAVKAMLRPMTIKGCRALAAKVLAAPTASAVRALLVEAAS